MPEIINPFSREAKRIVRNAPPIEKLPADIFKLAKGKVLWKKSEKRPTKDVLDLGGENDILSYHVLFLSAGLNFSAYSNEVRLVKEAIHEITKGRLTNAFKTEGEKFRWRFEDKFDVEEVTDLRNPGYMVNWKSLLPAIRHREMRLTEWDVSNGHVHSNRVRLQKNPRLGPGDLIELYSHLLAVEAFEYMSSLFKKDRGMIGSAGPLKDVADTLTEVSKESYKHGSAFAAGKSKKFVAENFPPCIHSILQGVSSGSRNYAISVLLTSFLSYARAAPGKVENPRLSDFIKEPKILDEEIMPLVYGAAERCQPPLFEDQPLEKMNVSYHLGLGLTEEIRLEDSGNSKWYVPPNCEKIQRESPGLCKPDELCKKIKNPLNYYFIKMKDGGKKDEGTFNSGQ